jgi:hypothetical protein
VVKLLPLISFHHVTRRIAFNSENLEWLVLFTTLQPRPPSSGTYGRTLVRHQPPRVHLTVLVLSHASYWRDSTETFVLRKDGLVLSPPSPFFPHPNDYESSTSVNSCIVRSNSCAAIIALQRPRLLSSSLSAQSPLIPNSSAVRIILWPVIQVVCCQHQSMPSKLLCCQNEIDLR